MKKISKVLVFNLILLFLLLYTGKILREKWEYKDGQYKIRYEMMRDNFDSDIKSVFLGSSGTFSDINQAIIYEESKIPVANLSHLLQSPFSSYHIINDYLKKNYGVKIIFLDVLGLTREVAPDHEERESRFYNALVSIENKTEYINGLKEEFDKDFRLNYHLPIFKYHDRWNRLKREDFFGIDNLDVITSYQLQKVEPFKPTKLYMKEDENFEKSDIGEKYLNKILDLAQSKNIDVVPFILPKMDYTLNEIEEYHRFAKEHNLEILDFTNEDLFNEVGMIKKRNLLISCI